MQGNTNHKYSFEDYANALTTFKGMRQVAGNQMLIRRQYLTDWVENENLCRAKAVCNGQRACLLGSMALANPEISRIYTHGEGLRAVTISDQDAMFFNECEERESVLARLPSLRLVYEACEIAAGEMVPHYRLEANGHSFESQAELLFEYAQVSDHELPRLVLELVAIAEVEATRIYREQEPSYARLPTVVDEALEADGLLPVA